MLEIEFRHGLGDCANFAQTLPLWTRRGHSFAIHTDPTKAPLFLAAGATIGNRHTQRHRWSHSPHHSPGFGDDYNQNKTGWNVGNSGVLPSIGNAADLWQELLSVRLNLDAQVTEQTRQTAAAYLATLSRPVILLHTKGNTGASNKNYPDALTLDLYRQLLDMIDGTLLLLDWDNRAPRLAHGRVRHLADDWRKLSTLELYEVLRLADLFIGVDSGPLHLLRFTSTPGLGIWTHNSPAVFALPRSQTVHAVGSRQTGWTRRRRFSFNIVDDTADIPSPTFLAEQARRLLSRSDPVLANMLAHTRTAQSFNPHVDRQRTFARFLDAAKAIPDPVIVETGCVRAEDDWGAGCSTLLLGYYLRQHGGHLHSVDLNEKNVVNARTWTTGLPVTVHHADSRDFLRGYSGKIDLLYLDSADVDTPGYQQCCLDEAVLALPKLSPSAAILIDDSPWSSGKWTGKGGLAIPWLMKQGWKISLAGYQVLMTK